MCVMSVGLSCRDNNEKHEMLMDASSSENINFPNKEPTPGRIQQRHVGKFWASPIATYFPSRCRSTEDSHYRDLW